MPPCRRVGVMSRAAAIEDLYRVFDKYPRFQGYLGCTHCVDEATQDGLRPVPLRALGVEEVRPVANNAGLGTFGEASDFKHFLPRLCELLAGEGRAQLSGTLIFAGLRIHGFPSWPEGERGAVLAYLRAWLKEDLAGHGDTDPQALLWFIRDMAQMFPDEATFKDAVLSLPYETRRLLAPLIAHLPGATLTSNDIL